VRDECGCLLAIGFPTQQAHHTIACVTRQTGQGRAMVEWMVDDLSR